MPARRPPKWALPLVIGVELVLVVTGVLPAVVASVVLDVLTVSLLALRSNRLRRLAWHAPGVPGDPHPLRVAAVVLRREDGNRVIPALRG